MSDEETQIIHTEEGQMLTAEYKDGQLQIVEVAAFDKGRYVQVLDSDKGVMNLDLLSLIKSDGNSTYQLVGTSEDDNNTVTCVLAAQDNDTEENESQDSYVIVNAEEEGRDPLVCLQSTLQQVNTQQAYRDTDQKKKPLTPEQILEKAKALQKVTAQRAYKSRGSSLLSSKPGRKPKSEVPPPTELLGLLSSPGFKLYLYSCKMCSFKCNAIKEMSKHKAQEHAGRGRAGAGRSAGATLQCARCPYRATVHTQLVKHIKDAHFEEDKDASILTVTEAEADSSEADVCPVDVLVCGACGFESGERRVFRRHISHAHGVHVTLSPTLVLEDDDSEETN